MPASVRDTGRHHFNSTHPGLASVAPAGRLMLIHRARIGWQQVRGTDNNPADATGQRNLTWGPKMFGLKNKRKQLESKYQRLMQESFQLSHSSRQKSDEKLAEAEKIRVQLDELDQADQ